MQGNFNYRFGQEARAGKVRPKASDKGAERTLLLCGPLLDRMRRNSQTAVIFSPELKPWKVTDFGNEETIKLNATQQP